MSLLYYLEMYCLDARRCLTIKMMGDDRALVRGWSRADRAFSSDMGKTLSLQRHFFLGLNLNNSTASLLVPEFQVSAVVQATIIQ